MPAGDIASLLDMPPSTLSSHLRALEGIGLMRATRVGRSIHYAVHINAMRQLFAFMTASAMMDRALLRTHRNNTL